MEITIDFSSTWKSNPYFEVQSEGSGLLCAGWIVRCFKGRIGKWRFICMPNIEYQEMSLYCK